MLKKESALISWIPALILLCVLVPMRFSWYSVYIGFAMPCVGFFAAWLACAHLFFYAPPIRDPKKGLIYLMLFLIYNPINVNLALITFIAAKNHLYLIIVNLIGAAIFLYLWWQTKMRNQGLQS